MKNFTFIFRLLLAFSLQLSVFSLSLHAAQPVPVQKDPTTGRLTASISADDLTDGSTNRLFTTAEKAKVAATSGTNTGDQTKSSLGLGNVDNTSDASKPVSTAQAAADVVVANAAAADATAKANARAAAQTVAALGSNALSLNSTATSNVVNTATWSGTPVTLTYAGGSDTAGEQQRLLVTVTSTTLLTVTPTSSTVYRNGATTALGASTVSFTPGRYWITFFTPDTGTTLLMEDSVVAASDIALLDAGNYFTTDNIEAALQQLGAALPLKLDRATRQPVATFVFDGSGSVITNSTVTSPSPKGAAFTIVGYTIIGDVSGSAVVDISVATGGSSTFNSITASAKPTLSSARRSPASGYSTTLTGWTTSVAADSDMKASITGVSTCTQVTVVLFGTY